MTESARYRGDLPQLCGDVFLTDGGIETTLIFHDGLELPDFAAFDLLKDRAGRAALEGYFRAHATIAVEHRVGFILESATWRASPDWGRKLGYSDDTLIAANRRSIEMLGRLRAELETPETRMVVSGCIGPRGDGYDVGAGAAGMMTAERAQRYHALQVRAFSAAGADMATAITMTRSAEAVGIARAAREAALPVAISFTVETDGRLPSGQPLSAAIEEVDERTDAAPAYYMINCAHPTHFAHVLEPGRAWTERLRGVRANASAASHAELDAAEELDDGDPAELGALYRDLRSRFPRINVLGGCCGTDVRHIRAIASACVV